MALQRDWRGENTIIAVRRLMEALRTCLNGILAADCVCENHGASPFKGGTLVHLGTYENIKLQ